jgi:vacuolar-type H+-ATPase subunit E/Vma4
MPYFNNNDDVYRLFSRDIISKSDEEIEKLKNEIDEKKTRSIKRIETEVHTRIFRSLEIDLSDLNADFSANLSRVKNEYTRVLMKKRRELLDSIVEEVRAKCIKFVESKKYKEFIDKKIKSISEKFCNKAIEFRIKKNDKIVKESIKNHLDVKYEIKEVNEIEIGGFSVVCYEMGVMLDETIDTKLSERQLWFYEHSDLAAN